MPGEAAVLRPSCTPRARYLRRARALFQGAVRRAAHCTAGAARDGVRPDLARGFLAAAKSCVCDEISRMR